jgi:hypothetical protein
LFQNHYPQLEGTPTGLYRNAIIENTIKEHYFKGPKDIGVKFPNLFGPIPLEVIAHIITIVSLPFPSLMMLNVLQ